MKTQRFPFVRATPYIISEWNKRAIFELQRSINDLVCYEQELTLFDFEQLEFGLRALYKFVTKYLTIAPLIS